MTKERKVLVGYEEGEKHVSKVLTGYEFSREEAEEMLEEVWKGGDEHELLEELKKKSRWLG